MTGKKVELNRVLAALDKKEYDFYDSLTDDEKKSLSLFILNRFSSLVSEGPIDLQAWYLLATNENVNKYYFDLYKHPKLTWLLLTTVSPQLGKQRRKWVAVKKTEKSTSSKTVKLLERVYPNAKSDEIRLLERLYTKADIERIISEHGFTEKESKEYL